VHKKTIFVNSFGCENMDIGIILCWLSGFSNYSVVFIISVILDNHYT